MSRSKQNAPLIEQRNNFLSVAESRYATIVATSQTIPWADMQRYLKDKASGKIAMSPIISSTM